MKEMIEGLSDGRTNEKEQKEGKGEIRKFIRKEKENLMFLTK